jgi:hypothetical protein
MTLTTALAEAARTALDAAKAIVAEHVRPDASPAAAALVLDFERGVVLLDAVLTDAAEAAE